MDNSLEVIRRVKARILEDSKNICSSDLNKELGFQPFIAHGTVKRTRGP
jgi:hypothetical protein